MANQFEDELHRQADILNSLGSSEVLRKQRESLEAQLAEIRQRELKEAQRNESRLRTFNDLIKSELNIHDDTPVIIDPNAPIVRLLDTFKIPHSLASPGLVRNHVMRPNIPYIAFIKLIDTPGSNGNRYHNGKTHSRIFSFLSNLKDQITPPDLDKLMETGQLGGVENDVSSSISTSLLEEGYDYATGRELLITYGVAKPLFASIRGPVLARGSSFIDDRQLSPGLVPQTMAGWGSDTSAMFVGMNVKNSHISMMVRIPVLIAQ